MSIFKRIRRGVPDATYTIKVQYRGKQIARQTPHTTKEAATAAERDLRRALKLQGWEALKHVTARRPTAEPTIAELFQLYRNHAGVTRELHDQDTITSNCYALRNILARAAGYTPKTLTPGQISELESKPVTVLTRHAITSFKKSVIQQATETEDDEAAQSLYRSANSILKQARSLLTADLLSAYIDANCTLPDLRLFIDEPGFSKVSKLEYHKASDTLLNNTFNALNELEFANPNAYLAIWLAIGFGLRKSEIAQITPQNFLHIDGRPAVRLTEQTKNGQVNVQIQSQHDAWARLEPWITQRSNANEPYLLAFNPVHPRGPLEWQPITPHARGEIVFDDVTEFMRNLGWQTQKAIHEFRAWSGSKIAEEHGIEAASQFLRHAEISTTQRYYGRYIKLIIPHTPFKLPPLQEPTIVPFAAQA